MPTILEIASATFGSVVKFIAERVLAFRDDENVGSQRNVFQATFQKKEMRCFW